jgi:hypothetical protein
MDEITLKPTVTPISHLILHEIRVRIKLLKKGFLTYRTLIVVAQVPIL